MDWRAVKGRLLEFVVINRNCLTYSEGDPESVMVQSFFHPFRFTSAFCSFPTGLFLVLVPLFFSLFFVNLFLPFFLLFFVLFFVFSLLFFFFFFYLLLLLSQFLFSLPFIPLSFCHSYITKGSSTECLGWGQAWLAGEWASRNALGMRVIIPAVSWRCVSGNLWNSWSWVFQALIIIKTLELISALPSSTGSIVSGF